MRTLLHLWKRSQSRAPRMPTRHAFAPMAMEKKSETRSRAPSVPNMPLVSTMAYKQTGPSRPITLAGNSQKEPKYSGSVGFHLFADPVGRKLIYAEAAGLWNTAAQSGGGARLQAKTVVCVARRQRQVELTRRLEEAAGRSSATCGTEVACWVLAYL